MGSLDSVFVAEPETVAKMMVRKSIPLGEVLGKHSDIDADVNDTTLTKLGDDQAVVAFFEKHLGGVVGIDLVGRWSEFEADGYWE
jgi:hypothetical protein